METRSSVLKCSLLSFNSFLSDCGSETILQLKQWGLTKKYLISNLVRIIFNATYEKSTLTDVTCSRLPLGTQFQRPTLCVNFGLHTKCIQDIALRLRALQYVNNEISFSFERITFHFRNTSNKRFKTYTRCWSLNNDGWLFKTTKTH